MTLTDAQKKAAIDIGQMAQRLAVGYFTHVAAVQVATDPRAQALSPGASFGLRVSEGYVFRKDGTRHRFHFEHFLQLARSDPVMLNDLARIWLEGALLKIGDTLALPENHYFDHAPELELVYHLRNGVAHGNVFTFTDAGKKRLANYPAHNRLASIRSDTKAVFEIAPNLQSKPVLFDFMGPGDILDLLMSISTYLIRMGYDHHPFRG